MGHLYVRGTVFLGTTAKHLIALHRPWLYVGHLAMWDSWDGPFNVQLIQVRLLVETKQNFKTISQPYDWKNLRICCARNLLTFRGATKQCPSSYQCRNHSLFLLIRTTKQVFLLFHKKIESKKICSPEIQHPCTFLPLNFNQFQTENLFHSQNIASLWELL